VRTISLDPTGPVAIRADGDGLRRLFANLMRNPLVHTPDGTPIEISLETTEYWATIEVRDHGPGLAIVAAIVNAHGGTVDASNPPSGGALLTVCLPLRPGESSRERGIDQSGAGAT
jgi:two-component system, OmpR family, sensor kinase